MINKNKALLNEIKEILKSKGIKPSYQRILVYNHINSHIDHPSVDTIFKAISGSIPTLSKTTIYNILNLFAKKGIVDALTIDKNEVRYDFIKKPHAHFMCKICGKIYDIHLKSDVCLKDFVEGHKVEDAHVNFKGVCKECLYSK